MFQLTNAGAISLSGEIDSTSRSRFGAPPMVEGPADLAAAAVHLMAGGRQVGRRRKNTRSPATGSPRPVKNFCHSSTVSGRGPAASAIALRRFSTADA